MTTEATTRADAVRRLAAAGCVYAAAETDLIWTRFDDGLDRARAVERRTTGEPLEYVVGQARFAGITVEVGPPAFIPRARAKAIVDAVSDTLRAGTIERTGSSCVLDLGCGSGAIAAAVKARSPDTRVHASDVDVDALRWARRSAERYGFEVHQGWWFDALPRGLRGRLDIVAAHLPYVPTSQVELQPRDFHEHEPAAAVDGGADGLDPLRQVTETLEAWLAPQGRLLTQVAESQVPTAHSIVDASGLCARRHSDEDGVVVLELSRSSQQVR